MAKINQVIYNVNEPFFTPNGLVGEHIYEQIKNLDKKRIAVVKNVLRTTSTSENNLHHFYIIFFPFSESPTKPILMTNQCWYPVDIPGRKMIEPEILDEKNNNGKKVNIRYKEVDFDKEFTWEDVIKGI